MIGAGFYVVGIAATVLTVLTLVVLRWLERLADLKSDNRETGEDST